MRKSGPSEHDHWIPGIPLTRRQFLAAFGVSGLIAGAIAWPRQGSPMLSQAWADDPNLGNRAFNLAHLVTPAHRALPTSEAGLVEAFADVMSRDMPLRVQSSGHCFAGISQTEDALLDLRLMNSIDIDESAQTITAGPGTQVGEVVAATAPTGLALTTGYCQTLALGGHVSGGGVGILSRRFGLVSDQLVRARILTADGQVKVASDDENPELLWALRGGGASSFGIVTQYTLRLREAGTMAFMEFLFRVPLADAARWLRQWQEMARNADPRLTFIIYINIRPNGIVGIQARLISSLDEAGSERAFNRLVGLGSLFGTPMVQFGTYHEVADLMWPPDVYGARAAQYASDMLGGVIDEAVWGEVLAVLAEHGPQSGLNLIVEGLGGAIDDVSNAVTAYAHRSEAQFKVQYSVSLPENADASPGIAALNQLTGALRPHGTGGAFYNYPEKDRPNWGDAYFRQNFATLKLIKRRYDPENVFNHPLSIPVD